MIGSLPDEVLALRKSAEHVIKLQEKMIVSLPPVSASKMKKLKFRIPHSQQERNQAE